MLLVKNSQIFFLSLVIGIFTFTFITKKFQTNFLMLLNKLNSVRQIVNIYVSLLICSES